MSALTTTAVRRSKRPGRRSAVDSRPPWRRNTSLETHAATTLAADSSDQRQRHGGAARRPDADPQLPAPARPQREQLEGGVVEAPHDRAPKSEPAVAPEVGIAAGLGKYARGAPFGDVAAEAGEVEIESRSAGAADRTAIAADSEPRRPDLSGPRPGVSDDLCAVAALQPVVPDGGAVEPDRPRGQRRVDAADPALQIAQVVVDPSRRPDPPSRSPSTPRSRRPGRRRSRSAARGCTRARGSRRRCRRPRAGELAPARSRRRSPGSRRASAGSDDRASADRRPAPRSRTGRRRRCRQGRRRSCRRRRHAFGPASALASRAARSRPRGPLGDELDQLDVVGDAVAVAGAVGVGQARRVASRATTQCTQKFGVQAGDAGGLRSAPGCFPRGRAGWSDAPAGRRRARERPADRPGKARTSRISDRRQVRLPLAAALDQPLGAETQRRRAARLSRRGASPACACAAPRPASPPPARRARRVPRERVTTAS